jgi:hypothetical protein
MSCLLVLTTYRAFLLHEIDIYIMPPQYQLDMLGTQTMVNSGDMADMR